MSFTEMDFLDEGLTGTLTRKGSPQFNEPVATMRALFEETEHDVAFVTVGSRVTDPPGAAIVVEVAASAKPGLGGRAVEAAAPVAATVPFTTNAMAMAVLIDQVFTSPPQEG